MVVIKRYNNSPGHPLTTKWLEGYTDQKMYIYTNFLSSGIMRTFFFECKTLILDKTKNLV